MDRYTAEEMRDVALTLEAFKMFKDPDYIDDYLTKAQSMISQAADAQEREDREKNYEYVARYISRINGEICENFGNRYDTKEEVMENAVWSCGVQTTIMRRTVGEWEEVK